MTVNEGTKFPPHLRARGGSSSESIHHFAEQPFTEGEYHNLLGQMGLMGVFKPSLLFAQGSVRISSQILE